MNITIDFSTVDSPLPGALAPTRTLTLPRTCDGVTVYMDGTEETCDRIVYVDPEWISAWTGLWPLRQIVVCCPDCIQA
jgi:hypothetical protein